MMSKNQKFNLGDLLTSPSCVDGWFYESGKKPTHGSVEVVISPKERSAMWDFIRVMVMPNTPVIFFGDHTVYDCYLGYIEIILVLAISDMIWVPNKDFVHV